MNAECVDEASIYVASETWNVADWDPHLSQSNIEWILPEEISKDQKRFWHCWGSTLM